MRENRTHPASAHVMGVHGGRGNGDHDPVSVGARKSWLDPRPGEDRDSNKIPSLLSSQCITSDDVVMQYIMMHVVHQWCTL